LLDGRYGAGRSGCCRADGRPSRFHRTPGRRRRRHDGRQLGRALRCGGRGTGSGRVEEGGRQSVADGRLRADRFDQGRQGLQRGRRVRRQRLGQLRVRHAGVVRQQGGRRR